MAYGAYGAHGEKSHLSYLSRAPSQLSLYRRLPKRAIYLFLVIGLALFFLLTHLRPSSLPSSQDRTGSSTNSAQTTASKPSSRKNLPCQNLPGADDVVVVLKTGSTELQDKLPIHLTTTLRCYQHYILFSDFEETFQGETIIDALSSVDPKIQEEHPDFELWRRLKKSGRAALQPHELSGPVSRPNGNAGKKSNPGWKLDKWKFLPMVNRTLHEYPDKKWYLFVETDTYVHWHGLLNYLKVLDWTQPLYVGAQAWIGNIEFAHGGSGFLASRTSMEQVVRMFRAQQSAVELFTIGHWAGDAILGKAFKDVGSPLKRGWPIWQGDDIGQITWERAEKAGRLWCRPAISYHHLSPSAVESLWEFEQDWITKTKGVSGRNTSIYCSN